MAVTHPPDKLQTPIETVVFEVESDLGRNGSLGASKLVVTESQAIVYDQVEGRFIESFRIPLSEIKKPKTEQLVDAFSIICLSDGIEVELLRSTNARTVQLSDACKRLEFLLEDKPLPPESDEVLFCPNCGRPLGKDSKLCLFCIDRRKTLLRLFEYAKPYKGRLMWGTFVTLAATTTQLAPPYITKLIVDRVLTEHKAYLFPWLIFALLAANALSMAFSIFRLRNIAFLGMRISADIRNTLFAKIQNLSINFYDRRSVGSLMSRMINDTGALYDVLVDGIPVLLNQSMRVIGIPIALFILNPVIAVYALLPAPFILLAIYLFRTKMTRVWSRFWHNWSRFGSSLNGVLQGSRVVKAFHGEHREISRFDKRIIDLSKTQYTAESSWASFFPMVQFVMALSTVTVWWVGGHAALKGTMTIGDVTAFVAYVVMLQDPLNVMQRIIDWTTRALTAAERVFEVLDTPVDIADTSDSVSIPEIRGDIEFIDVHFGYDKAREVLHGIDMKVKGGEVIGLVGHSGAGKSTLINLLMRFYDPTLGKILLDGVDLRKVKLDDFRRQVGVVLQENYLFPGSIRGNIAYGRPAASLEEILEAAKAANAHDFIVNFPDGYDTYVGERGQRLSGGERQRIAIARAILHDPKVLVLDEATASVDTETERMIQDALDRLIAGRTVFAIAHRLSTLRNADRLIVMDDGRIVEVGTHDELLAKEGGIYKRLVEMQQEVNRMRSEYLVE